MIIIHKKTMIDNYNSKTNRIITKTNDKNNYKIWDKNKFKLKRNNLIK